MCLYQQLCLPSIYLVRADRIEWRSDFQGRMEGGNILNCFQRLPGWLLGQRGGTGVWASLRWCYGRWRQLQAKLRQSLPLRSWTDVAMGNHGSHTNMLLLLAAGGLLCQMHLTACSLVGSGVCWFSHLISSGTGNCPELKPKWTNHWLSLLCLKK